MAILKKDFYSKGTVKVAKELIGKVLVSGKCSGRIVETEAYTENDPASHSCNGMTPRNEAMYGEPGHAYVYLCYGSHWMLNAVCEKRGVAGAVLIRALEPLAGVSLMRKRRGGNSCLTNGPGRLTQAMGVSGKNNRQRLFEKGLCIMDGKAGKVARSSRIGIGSGLDRKWRFYEKGNPNVSLFKE